MKNNNVKALEKDYKINPNTTNTKVCSRNYEYDNSTKSFNKNKYYLNYTSHDK